MIAPLSSSVVVRIPRVASARYSSAAASRYMGREGRALCGSRFAACSSESAARPRRPLWSWRRAGRRRVDIGASGVTQGGRDSGTMQDIEELLLILGLGCGPARSLDRVERDWVDMRPIVAVMVEPLGQQSRVLGLVVDAAHQRVFDADAALGRQEVIVGGVDLLPGLRISVYPELPSNGESR